MITDLVNQISAKGIIPAEWEFCTIVNYYKGKCDSLERENCRGLKLKDQDLKVVGRIIWNLLKRQVDIDERQFCFTPGCGTTYAIFVLRQLQEKYLT